MGIGFVGILSFTTMPVSIAIGLDELGVIS
jgi:hypothetical protein